MSRPIAATSRLPDLSPERFIRGSGLPRTGRGSPTPVCPTLAATAHEESPPTPGRATGRKPGVGDDWLWNSNETPRPDR